MDVPKASDYEFATHKLVVVSGALTLVTNCVMAWNTCGLERAMNAGPLKSTSSDLSHIGPVGYKHINFRGTYHFPVAERAARLTQVAA